jgi:hypothetical protein
MSGLLELAERCEKATGPDRELDELIDKAALPHEWANEFFDPSRHDLPRYTALLDAAMTLVPEEAWWSVMRAPCAEGYDAEVASDDHRRAATPALALCAAALRALAHQTAEERDNG